MSVPTLSAQESATVLRAYTEQMVGCGLSPFTTGLLVEMPCCGFQFAAEHIDAAEQPSRFCSPLRWTCPLCAKTYVASELGLEEAAVAAPSLSGRSAA
jgi:hypothetical protein